MAIISVYGSAATPSDHPDYIAGVAVGRALAEAGFVVMTGGYDGMMGAVSQGAHEGSGHVIGVTSKRIEEFRPISANIWIKEAVIYLTLHERLMHLVTRADGYVVMPGGLGTLNELVTVWELMRVREIPRNPIVCYGDYWRDALAGFYASSYMPHNVADWITYAHSPEEVITLLKNGS